MRLVILDRDGVINADSDEYIKSVDEFVPLPGSVEAIARLTSAGFRVAVATNQSGVARGLFDLPTLNAMHDKLRDLVAQKGGQVDEIVFCPHGPADGCDCRKPKPGLLLQLAHKYGIELSGVPVIGDSLRDLQSALAVDAQPILVRTGKGERTLAQLTMVPELSDVPVYEDLSAAADALIENQIK